MVYGEEFSKDYVLKAGVTRNVSDDHNWWSVFSRPVRSRFNRKQRVTVCMAMLMLTVLACGMYYDGSAPVILDPLTHLGPIPLDARDVSGINFEKLTSWVNLILVIDAYWTLLQSNCVPTYHHDGIVLQKRACLEKEKEPN